MSRRRRRSWNTVGFEMGTLNRGSKAAGSLLFGLGLLGRLVRLGRKHDANHGADRRDMLGERLKEQVCIRGTALDRQIEHGAGEIRDADKISLIGQVLLRLAVLVSQNDAPGKNP